MAFNPFKPSSTPVDKPNRNAFDLSFTNHITGNFGVLYPVLCKETLPGDTFEIESALGLRFMPLAFPIQTKCKAYVHFFYQRTKNLWPDFENFIYGNDKIDGNPLIPPYIDCSNGRVPSCFKTGSLGDYLGLPTVKYGGENGDNTYKDFSGLGIYKPSDNSLGTFPSFTDISFDDYSHVVNIDEIPANPELFHTFNFHCTGFGSATNGYTHNIEIFLPNCYLDPNNTFFGIYIPKELSNKVLKCLQFGSCTSEIVSSYDNLTESGTVVRFSYTQKDMVNPKTFSFAVISRFTSYNPAIAPILHDVISPSFVSDSVLNPNSPLLDNSRYQISSLPFRCYESIYNAFYRDDRNNPLKDAEGSLFYNKYLLKTGHGPDNTDYVLHRRNWELDQFTSCVESPQQGVAPLVGISSLGDLTFSHEGKSYTFQAETADDADTITGVKVTEDIPNAVARSIVNVATSGISINDFRNVNSFQRWLETNIRRGLKYKDQTLARWGVEATDISLDMPEFIGGYSVDVDVNTVTNVAQSSDAVLGDFAGSATAFGGSNHKITKFCDQHGFIMAILSVVPTPVYTQQLPRMFSRNDALSYFSPEFGQIGMQAVRTSDIVPLESSSSKEDNKVFGYQRPWFDYIYSNDEAHGLFRTDFNQFLLSRTFDRVPSLGPDFTTISSDSLNDIFTVKNSDCMLGMIRFNIVAKRPIPSVSLPKL